jgi:malonyl-CoA/methylmalonyl-CoA synthetase
LATPSQPIPLFPGLRQTDELALLSGDETLSYKQLSERMAAVGDALANIERVALLTDASLQTAIFALGAVAAGVTIVPINPKAGELELEHFISDSAPDGLLAPDGVEIPGALDGVPVIRPGMSSKSEIADDAPADHPAVILYTSGTTGLPKGVLIPRRAIASNLDSIAAAWEWTGTDRLTHALPLFHVHGLILGVFGPIRLGGQLDLLPKFSVEAVSAAFDRGATMLFGVPTMYNRIAEACADDAKLAAPLRKARILVSGSAALPSVVHERIEAISGQRIVERYGMTETMMNCAVRAGGDRRAGYVGPPVDGVELRLDDDDGAEIAVADDETVGEIKVRGPNLFSGYLNQPDATDEVMNDGWFSTGDLATRAPDGYVRIVGRRSTDLIKSAGYRIGAGEIESALLEHPAVSEAAVTGEPDPDLGERIIAWVVLRPSHEATGEELSAHVGKLLSSHKRPREVRFLGELPRNAMGKVVKKQLATD